jgi:hypothetical protein
MTGIFQPGGRPGRVPNDADATVLENVDISMFDLYRTVMAKGQSIITGRTFRGCRIEGPVVMLVLSGTKFEATDFGATGGDIRNIVLRPASPEKVTGVIPVQDCVFVACQFHGVGFTGPEPFLQQVLALETK